MADRLSLVVYKTPTQRIIEASLVVAGTMALAGLWQSYLPDISPSYIIVASLFLGFAIVPRLGSLIARRRGNELMGREERNRRYLAEMGPMLGATPALNPVRRRSRSR
jgi:hypothetical protein